MGRWAVRGTVVKTGVVNVGIPSELAEAIDWIQGLGVLGIKGRNEFVTQAVREAVAKHVEQIMAMHAVGEVLENQHRLLPHKIDWPGSH